MIELTDAQMATLRPISEAPRIWRLVLLAMPALSFYPSMQAAWGVWDAEMDPPGWRADAVLMGHNDRLEPTHFVME